MGLCGSGGVKLTAEEMRRRDMEMRRNRELNEALGDAQEEDTKLNKLLLLGAGESGKSTLFKQMISIYGKGWPPEECKQFKPIIHQNIIGSLKTLCEFANPKKLPGLKPDVLDKKKHEKYRTWALEVLDHDDVLDEKMASKIAALWNDKCMQAAYDRRSEYQLTDSAAYFFDKVDEVVAKDYVPSEQDVLRSRVRTTGIVENHFIIDDNQFRMYDVGGQRNERKKWIHCFENVTAVLFVAAISAYDQVLYEDNTTNRMTEALNLFEEICNSRWFRSTAMILFLNKNDLFQEKIKKKPIKDCFPEYAGDNSYDDAKKYILDQFLKKNKNPNKQIYYHVTCATDKQNVEFVFNSVKNIIINNALKDAGLLG